VVRQWYRIILRQAQRNCVPGNFDLGTHLASARCAEPYVLRFVFLPAGLVAEVEIETEQLARMVQTGSKTPAISAFTDHDPSLRQLS